MAQVTYQIFDPNTFNNPYTRLYKCEVRAHGFLADWDFFYDRSVAEDWGSNHDGTINLKASDAVLNSFERWANK